jgi:hypothetical protein
MSTDDTAEIAERTREQKLAALAQKDDEVSDRTQELAERYLKYYREESS